MTTLLDLLPDAEAVLSLEPVELAGIGLELICLAEPGHPSRLHPGSFTSRDALGKFPEEKHAQIQFAMAEAWNWLVHEGLIAPSPGDTSGWHFVTRRGKLLRNRASVDTYRNGVTLSKGSLHPQILQCCWPAFLRGEYDTAVFQAFRELEISIRESGHFKAEDYGVDLARRAFHVSSEPLTDLSKPVAEREALASLMAGALGSYKNPHSHRKVQLSADEASETITLASHLLKIIESRSKEQR